MQHCQIERIHTSISRINIPVYQPLHMPFPIGHRVPVPGMKHGNYLAAHSNTAQPFETQDQRLLHAGSSEGGILARQNGFSVDTEVGNSEVVTFWCLWTHSLSSTPHLKSWGSCIRLLCWIRVKRAAFCFRDPQSRISLLIDTLSHYWPQPTLCKIQDFKSDAACSLKKDHKTYSKHWSAIRIQSHPAKDLVQGPLPTKGTAQF